MRLDRKGFTLIELIIVVIIIGILAATAAPMMSSNVGRARASEALAGLGALRTAERLHFVEHGSYVAFALGGGVDGTALNAYIHDADLSGRYFNAAAYNFVAATNLLGAAGTSSGAPSATDVGGYNITMSVINGAVSNNGY